MQRIAQSSIHAQDAGRTLADWLATRFTYHTKPDWEDRIHAGQVTVNGELAVPAQVLVADDAVVYTPSPAEEPAVDPSYGIVHEDDDILVINKSGNLPCHPAGRFFQHTLWYLLQDRGEQIRFVHRIDRETSGLVIVARSKESARRYSEAFEKRSMEKEYLAVVEGPKTGTGFF